MARERTAGRSSRCRRCRLTKAGPAELKVAAKIIRPSALLSGNYAFVRDVARALDALDADQVSRAVSSVTARR